MKKICLLLLVNIIWLRSGAQSGIPEPKVLPGYKVDARKEIRLPDIMGFKTLKCDFHIHTIFSDGFVIPKERVDEAWREGLDAIAITDHDAEIREGNKADNNRPYELAKPVAKRCGVILIHGLEYSRDEPVGHLGLIFIKDANKYADPSLTSEQVVNLASDDGAFITINHSSALSDFQVGFVKQKKIHAMEVMNEGLIYTGAIDMCNQFNLTKISGSDIHHPINTRYDLERKHRNFTLVFAKERNEESIKEALFEGRTVGYADDNLIGNKEYLHELIKASLVASNFQPAGMYFLCDITNTSDVPIILEGPDHLRITFPANRTIQLKDRLKNVEIVHKVINTYVSSTQNMEYPLSFFLKLTR